jgi:hypothetical protein
VQSADKLAGPRPGSSVQSRRQHTGAGTGRAHRRSGVLAGSVVVTSRRQGAVDKHQWDCGVAPGRLRRDGETERWLGAATRGGELRELWGGKRVVRAASIGERKARRGRSPERGRRRWCSNEIQHG